MRFVARILSVTTEGASSKMVSFFISRSPNFFKRDGLISKVERAVKKKRDYHRLFLIFRRNNQGESQRSIFCSYFRRDLT